MRRFCPSLALLVAFAAPAVAQNLPQWDLSGGYNLRIFKQQSGTHLSLQGWYGSGEYNIFTWLGAEGDLTGTYRSQPFPGSHVYIYTGEAGPRFYPLRHRKLTPWGHVLFGGAYYHERFPAFGGAPHNTFWYGSKVWEAGGGVDLDIWKHWGIRLFELDYGKTSFAGPPSQSNVRIAVGFTYRFGSK